jgi:ABC-type Fe2+-enterobactin transport system substrate-binding protein
MLEQLGFTSADLPGGLHASQSQGKRHDIVQLGGENLAAGLNGQSLFLFAGDQKTPTRLTPTRCWRICPPLKANAFIRWGRKPSAWITTAPYWCCSA